MKQLISILLITIVFKSSAQNLTYEKLDSISSKISKLQLQANNLVYNDGKDDYILSFTENNFQILYSTGKAQKVVHKKKGDKEYLYLTENIDLTKAFDIYQALYPGLAGVFRLTFPEGVKTQVYTNGIYTNTLTEYYLEFFYDRDEGFSSNKPSYPGASLLVSLSSMIVFLKSENMNSCEEFIYNSFSNVKMDKYGSGVKNKYEKYRENIFKEVDYYSKLSQYGGFQNDISHAKAAEYLEKAILIKMPRVYYQRFGFNMPYSALLHHLSYSGNYTRLGELVNSPDIYFQNITEHDLITHKSQYLMGIGKCLEAEKMLLNTLSSPNSSKELKSKIKYDLYLLYKNGCKGEDSDRVKKNKKLANQYG